MTNNPSAVSIEALRLAAEHALDSLAETLTSVLSSTISAPASTILGTLSQLTTHHLGSVVPLLATMSRKKDAQRYADALDALFGQLTTRVLVPLTRSFSALSSSHISALFTTSKKGRQRKPLFDIRPDVFGFLRTVLDSLQALCASSLSNDILIAGAESVFEALALSAVRELEVIFSPPAPPGALDDNGFIPVRSIASGTVSSPRPPTAPTRRLHTHCHPTGPTSAAAHSGPRTEARAEGRALVLVRASTAYYSTRDDLRGRASGELQRRGTEL